MRIRLLFVCLFALAAPLLQAQTFTLSPTDCGDHRIIVCTTQVVGGGTFHIALGRDKHTLTLTGVGANKLTATDVMLRGVVIPYDGIDRLHADFSVKDASGNIVTGSCNLTLTARNVNGTKNYTLTAGTLTLQ
jgi:hypothetical protein